MPRKPTLTTRPRGIPAAGPERAPQNHRTVDRVTRILEEVVYSPGMTFAELVRALGAPKSSVHGFIRGLLAKGWLHQEQHRFYLGPAVYGLTIASGHIRAGLVTQEDLAALHAEAGLPVSLGVQAGDHLIYVAEAGSDAVGRFDWQSNIRRSLLATAGGKALLAERRDVERDSYLRRRSKDEARAGRSVPRGVPDDQEDPHCDQCPPQREAVCDRDDGSQHGRRTGRVHYPRRPDGPGAAAPQEVEPDSSPSRRLVVRSRDDGARSDLGSR